MILMIDNYDSFTYNLVQYLGQLGAEVAVYRNDEVSLGEIERMDPEAIFLSPGPCTPQDAGITVGVIRHFHSTFPILGVCLGHQAIGYAFAWDNVCVSEVRTQAKNLTCPESAGSCSHTLCATGGALVSDCDSTKVSPSCTSAICAANPACCTTAWDATCVAQVSMVCGYDCN